MIRLSEKEFRNEIKNGTLRSVYLFIGNEEYLKQISRKLLREAIIDDESFSSFNYSRLSASEDLIAELPAELESALNILPFMAEKRLIEIIDVDTPLFKDKSLDKIAELILNKDNFETSVVCFVGSPDSFDLVTKKDIAAFWQPFEKKLGSAVAVVSFDTPPNAELAKWVIRHIKHEGLECSPEMAKLIIETGGKNMQRLAFETDKLACYLLANGKTEVTAEDLATISTAAPELAAFALSNAILSGKTAIALHALENAKTERVKPTAFLSDITKTYTNMLAAKELPSLGLSDKEIGARLGVNEYQITLSRNAAAGVSKELLERSLELCIECDGQLKSDFGSYTPVENLICTLGILRKRDRL